MNKNIVYHLSLFTFLASFNIFAVYDQNVQTVLNQRDSIIDLQPKMLIFKTLNQEVSQQELRVQGTIPAWLKGTLFRTGPAKFDTQTQLINHIFDGFGMIYAFDFTQSGLKYTNKFLESACYKHALQTGELISGFSGDNNKGIFWRIATFLWNLIPWKEPVPYDNANVNIAKIADHYVALTETPFALEFDQSTVATLGSFTFDDNLNGHFSLAHPHIDPVTGDLFNIIVKFGRFSDYQIYKVSPGSTHREIIATLSTENPSYMHSFSLTKDYIILTQMPLTVNPLELIFSSKGFIDNFVWDEKRETIFSVINRHTGEIIGNYESKAYLTFHHINAYQKDSAIILDLVGYDDASLIYKFSFEELFNEDPLNAEKALKKLTENKLIRYTIDLKSKKTECQQISSTSIEMPRINDIFNTNPYCFVYGIGSDSSPKRYGSSLVKIDVNNGQAIAWIDDECTVGEPIFVADPHGKNEDDGVLLSVVLDHHEKKSFLLLLDAKNMQEIARAYVPHHIPFGLHGNFFSH